MTYQVLARAWRPQRFSDLLGQEPVVQTLRNALETGTCGQAYLFSGPRGVGKTTAARLLAKAVNCTSGPTAEPCGECDSCREVAAGASIDVIEIDAATHTQVDKVRDLQELLRYHPTRDRYRVLIVDEVHMLSPASFNALLKTIEEPPPYVLWILATTERTKVPKTVLSRCQQLEFRPVAADLIRARLQEIAAAEGFHLAPAAAAAIAGAADGSVRDALSLLDQLRAFAAGEVDDAAVAAVLGLPLLETTATLVAALAEGRVRDGLGLIREQLAGGQDPAVLFLEIGRALRSLLYLALDPELDPTLAAANRAALEPLAGRLGGDALGRMLALWVAQEALLREAANRELALEVAALKLARWPTVRGLEAWLAGAGPLPSPATGAAEPGAVGPGSPPPAAGGSPESRGAVRGAAAARPAPRLEDPAAAPPANAAAAALTERVAADPGVALAARILGGEVVAVRADGDGS